MYTRLILLVTIGLLSKYLYNEYQESEDMFDSYEQYNLVSDYYIGGTKMNRRKPILWIHTTTDRNNRNWMSFGSRSTTTLNQPYLQITMKSIYDKCKKSFNIVLIDDDTFRRLLSWNIDLDDLADPVKSHYRKLGLSMIIQSFGGMVVPQSLLCTKNLYDIYKTGLSKNSMFVFDTINMSMMGCRRGSSTMNSFIEYQELLYKDKSGQTDFKKSAEQWLTNRKSVSHLNAKYIGLEQQDGTPITIDQWLGTSIVLVPSTIYGIYLPAEEILKRIKYSWFARMSTNQVLNSHLMIAKYMLAAY